MPFADDSRFPQVLMRVPLAAINGVEAARCLLSAAEAGRTDSSAPQSTRKERPERRSHTVIVFFSHGPTAEFFSGRPVCFPKPRAEQAGWTRRGVPSCTPAGWPSYRTWCGRSTVPWVSWWWVRQPVCAMQRCQRRCNL